MPCYFRVKQLETTLDRSPTELSKGESPLENRDHLPGGGTIRGPDLRARGENFLWGMGGALALGLAMILGFLILVVWNGLIVFYPKPFEEEILRGTFLIS